jgi:hypothetical protein
MKPKTVKAWAVVNENERIVSVHTEDKFVAESNAKFYGAATPSTYRVKPVRIVPEAEYRRMMAAVKYAEAVQNRSSLSSILNAGEKYIEARAKGKVKK